MTRSALAQERESHRTLFHGGHVPDGEQIIEPERFSILDLPREQLVFGALLLVVLAVVAAVRLL